MNFLLSVCVLYTYDSNLRKGTSVVPLAHWFPFIGIYILEEGGGFIVYRLTVITKSKPDNKTYTDNKLYTDNKKCPLVSFFGIHYSPFNERMPKCNVYGDMAGKEMVIAHTL